MKANWIKQHAIPVLICAWVVLFTFYFQTTDNEFLKSLRNRMEWIAYDLRLKYSLPDETVPHPSVVIIDVDEKSLAVEGRWPWPRAKMAQLVERVFENNAVVLAFDIVFPEAEENIAKRVLDRIRIMDRPDGADTTRLVREIAPQFDGDGLFAASMALRDESGEKRDIVMGYAFQSEYQSAGILGPPLNITNREELQGVFIHTDSSYTGNLQRLQEAARGGGFFSSDPDDDGVYRRYVLIARYGENIYPSLALETVRLLEFIDSIHIGVDQAGEDRVIKNVSLGKYRNIPTDGAGAALIPFRGERGSFTYISATDVLNGTADLSALEGAAALVGTTAIGLFDLRSTPVAAVYPGVEIHANVIAALLDQNYPANPNFPDPERQLFPYEPDWAYELNLTITLLLGLALAGSLPLLSPAKLSITAASSMLLLVAFNFWAWLGHHLVVAIAVPLAMVFVIATISFAYGYLYESRVRSKLKGMFGQYVPPQLVEEMSDREEDFGFEGDRRVMTVLFADIRGFTTISESLSAVELKNLLNRFFTPMTEIIFHHRGTIDKYVGDMIMAFWNAPVQDEQHVTHAINAALDMLKKVEAMKPELLADGYPEINIGIGLNTGLMNVGNMGSEFRRSYTVLGDSVNLGSRLEGLTKFYGVRLIVGEHTREGQDDFLFRRLDLVRVKGKHEPVTIYEPVCRKEEASQPLLSEVHQHEQALDHYLERGWDEARQRFGELAQQHPDKLVYKIYLKRMAASDPAKLPADWDGVFEHTSK